MLRAFHVTAESPVAREEAMPSNSSLTVIRMATTNRSIKASTQPERIRKRFFQDGRLAASDMMHLVSAPRKAGTGRVHAAS